MVKKEIQEIRELMKEEGIQAYWIPSTDPHQSEYLPDCWNRRSWLSGFTGSAGDLVVLENSAYLWTDSRYFLQAEHQLRNSGIQLMKLGIPEFPTIHEFLKKNLDGKLGMDPELISISEAKKIQTLLGTDRVAFLKKNLVDRVWKDRPGLPKGMIEIHDIQFSGLPVPDKLTEVRKAMGKKDAEFHIVTQLDAIAWLFNIRGQDVEFNPLVVAYAVVGPQKAWLFVDPVKVSSELRSYLPGQVEIMPYTSFGNFLKEQTQGKTVLLDFASANYYIGKKLDNAILVEGDSPVTLLKAKKNDVEIEGFKRSHIRDGASMVRFFMWLEREVPGGQITEISAAEKLTEFRSGNEHYRGPSFGSISGYGSNGAIVHYSATADSNADLKNEGIYLIDSGGQYNDGTTDITRTLALGTPTAEQIDRFTRVLKGHLSLGMARFPKGTCGPQLDTLARKALWDAGLNYGHGTGHGVGSFLCVHEGPQAVSYYRGAGVPMEPGMVVSNEPGYYKTGEYGIRIENLVFVKECPGNETDPSEFLCFENLTMCPIQKTLVDTDLLSPEEREEFNRYQQEVFNKLSPLLNPEEVEWLRQATCPL